MRVLFNQRKSAACTRIATMAGQAFIGVYCILLCWACTSGPADSSDGGDAHDGLDADTMSDTDTLADADQGVDSDYFEDHDEIDDGDSAADTDVNPDNEPPAAPTDLSATPISASRVELLWTASSDNVGVAGYLIFRDAIQIGTSNVVTYADTTTTGSTTYLYHVVAFDAAGNTSNPSNVATVTTPNAGTCWNGGYSGTAPWTVLDGEGGSASAEYDDVYYCINTVASAGDTINIGEDTATWSTGKLTINKSITLKGAGKNKTIITMGGSSDLYDSWDEGLFYVSGNGITLEISDMKIDGNDYLGLYCINIRSGDNSIINIHDMQFVNARRTMYIDGYIYGVIYSSIFDNCTAPVGVFCDNSSSWSRNGIPGSYGNTAYGGDAVYIEDCTFTQSASVGNHAAGGAQGARYVVRYNTITNRADGAFYDVIDSHGHCENAYGTYAGEIYGNEFYASSSQFAFGSLIRLRGGKMRAFNNTLTGYEDNNGVELLEYRASTLYTTCGADTTYCPDEEGYPCTHQLNDAYFWNITDDGSQITVENVDDAGNRDMVQYNRDYWAGSASHMSTLYSEQTGSSSPFDGTSGVGWGAIADRPATCTTGVAYWATDEGEWNSINAGNDGQLYKCTDTNTWELYYVPYTYPHPLRADGG